jgi:hypothetical protein
MMVSVDWPGFLSILIGGTITFVASGIFYVRAARDLRQETARLRQHTTLILRGLEEAGLVEYNRDEQGEIVGMVIKISAAAGGAGGMTGTLTVGEQNDNDAHQE